jgi:hypothetical protein
MPPSVPQLVKKTTQAKTQRAPQVEAMSRSRITQRQAALTLIVLALAYAFLAGFHTNFDPDMGWHMPPGDT